MKKPTLRKNGALMLNVSVKFVIGLDDFAWTILSRMIWENADDARKKVARKMSRGRVMRELRASLRDSGDSFAAHYGDDVTEEQIEIAKLRAAELFPEFVSATEAKFFRSLKKETEAK